ncbi:MAG: spore germination protein [Clostridiaceae bacterium]
MFRFLYKKLGFNKKAHHNTDNKSSNENNKLPDLLTNINENINNIKNLMGISTDIIFREFTFGKDVKINAVLIFIDGLTEKILINDIIIRPLMYDTRSSCNEEELEFGNIDIIRKSMLSVGEVNKTSSISEIIDGVLSGNTIFLIDGCNEALVINSRYWENRGIDEPKTEAVVRGPREGYSETINMNLTLLRRKIKNRNLTFETMKIGEQTKTIVTMAYINGIVNPKLVKEVKKRLKKINTDAILESGYIEQYIEDEAFSLFPTIGNSEKPDTTAAKILEGRVAIFVDGTPFVLTVPMLFIEGFQNAEDYYSRVYYSSVVRCIRFLGFGISILAPAVYVVLATFHQELIPTALLFSFAASREGVPFPAGLEAGLMILTFEIIREAGVRLPRPVGQAVSIVGALVIGESAVTAGLVSGLMVIVVAITAVSSFMVPVFHEVDSILRFIFLILGGTLGIFGITIGVLAVLIHLASLRSFGAPYLSPFAPLTGEDLKDTFIRAPLWKMKTRPKAIRAENVTRQQEEMKPEKPKNNKN